MWSNFATEFAYNIITNLRMSWSGLSCHQGYLLLRISTTIPQCGRVWWWPGPCLVVTPHCEKLFWIRPQTQRTTTCSVTHQPMGHIRGTNSCLDRENIYTIYMLSLYMPPYSIFTQRFREYWNYGNGIKMCTGGTSYILQECSYKDIIQLQDLHNIIIFDLSIENCSGVKTPF